MKCKKIAVAVALALASSAASAVVLDSYSTGFEDFTLGAMSNGVTTQNGWSGGAQGGFQNATPGDEAITTADAHTGTQSWRFTNGYNSPGQGTPFSPNLALGLGDAGVTSFSGSVWFKPVQAGDLSSMAINTGTRAGTDRAEILAYLVNEADGVHLYTFGDNFAPVDIALGLDAGLWHQLSFGLTKSGSVDTLSISVDGGAAVVITPAGLGDFRDDNAFGYADSSNLKFNARSLNAGYPATPDPSRLGFYLDDISYQVEGAAAVPEPGSLALLGLGLAGLAMRRRKQA